MKILLAFLSLIITALAADPRPPTDLDFSKTNRGGSMKLDAKETGTGRAIQRNWETSWGSYDRDFFRTKTIAVTTTNLGREPIEATAEVLWFATTLLEKETYIFHRETFPVARTGYETKRVSMPELFSNVQDYKALGEKWVAGAKYAGWMVLVRSDRAVLSARASTPSLEALLRSEKLPALLGAYETKLAEGR